MSEDELAAAAYDAAVAADDGARVSLAAVLDDEPLTAAELADARRDLAED